MNESPALIAHRVPALDVAVWVAQEGVEEGSPPLWTMIGRLKATDLAELNVPAPPRHSWASLSAADAVKRMCSWLLTQDFFVPWALARFKERGLARTAVCSIVISAAEEGVEAAAPAEDAFLMAPPPQLSLHLNESRARRQEREDRLAREERTRREKLKRGGAAVERVLNAKQVAADVRVRNRQLSALMAQWAGSANAVPASKLTFSGRQLVEMGLARSVGKRSKKFRGGGSQ